MAKSIVLSDIQMETLLAFLDTARDTMCSDGSNDHDLVLDPSNQRQVENFLRLACADQEKDNPGVVKRMIEAGLQRGRVTVNNFELMGALIEKLKQAEDV